MNNQECIAHLKITREKSWFIKDYEAISHAINVLETVEQKLKPQINATIERLEEIT